MAELSSSSIKNIGWRVTFAGFIINLALGILYTWSVISKGIPESWGWTESQKSLPYSVACLTFSIIMVLAGRMQDKLGPRLVATLGGILVGIGLVVASLSTGNLNFVVGFGLLAGAGIGFGYASTTPPAVKWFPAAKTGLIAGIVVSGFGLASAYAAPLANYMSAAYGTQRTMLVLGIAFTVVVVTLSQFVKAPPAGYKPAGSAPAPAAGAAVKKEDFTSLEMLGTIQFYLLWFMYACGAGAGLMIISKMAAIADKQAGLKLGFILVGVLALGNGAGRVLAGLLSDKLGRKPTMMLCFLVQAVVIMLLSRATQGSMLAAAPILALISALVGANYGANLSLFPSITKDFYGLKNFGMNYGLVFTAWGVGGFMLALGAGKVYDLYHTFSYAYYGAVTLLILAALVALLLKAPKPRTA
jgi:OFA family oxalate/formate antiporter-like MFS transporter